MCSVSTPRVGDDEAHSHRSSRHEDEIGFEKQSSYNECPTQNGDCGALYLDYETGIPVAMHHAMCTFNYAKEVILAHHGERLRGFLRQVDEGRWRFEQRDQYGTVIRTIDSYPSASDWEELEEQGIVESVSHFMPDEFESYGFPLSLITAKHPEQFDSEMFGTIEAAEATPVGGRKHQGETTISDRHYNRGNRHQAAEITTSYQIQHFPVTVPKNPSIPDRTKGAILTSARGPSSDSLSRRERKLARKEKEVSHQVAKFNVRVVS
mmetsp:Transcript_6006/g.12656  ORF Transcript_6006/g.12656 Transcript_6006/m.12656 type:complete len:265 (-) Transcript_6006:2536-3330(-)